MSERCTAGGINNTSAPKPAIKPKSTDINTSRVSTEDVTLGPFCRFLSTRTALVLSNLRLYS